MSMRQRRIVSAMTAEAQQKRERLEAEGKDPLTGRPVCEGVGCACNQPGEGGAPASGRSRRRGGAGVSEGGGEGGTEA
jgi:hypothetical protein